jgi:F-type H+-transporting ATPase subunit delta
VTNRTAATRYARALLDVAVAEKSDLNLVDRDLTAFVGLFTEHPTLAKVLLNPAVPVHLKRAAVTELTVRTKLTPVVAKLLALLAERDRLVLLPELLNAYRESMLDFQKVVRARVTTALPLAPGRAQAIEQSLADVTGGTVLLETSVDPSIIGGVIARIGSTVYDGSVTRQLERMKAQLIESV